MFKLISFCLLISVACLNPAVAMPGTPYDAATIPKQLQAYANAVVRHQESVTEVKDLDQVIFRYKEAITILNSNGAEYAQIAVFYDKSRQLKNLKGAVYDNTGKLIKKIASADFQDVSAISSISLFEDDRVKHYTPTVNYYPYTVEYEYELRFKHTFFFPDWKPQKAIDIAVENSTYRLITKPGFEIRLKELNLSSPRKETQTSEASVTEWSSQNITALRSEPYSPPAQQFITMVEIAPVTFSYEGISGKFTNWQEYGKWSYDNLLQGRDILPPATEAIIKDLVKNSPSEVEKIRKIYEYTQQKNRYISVQIGIGGLQPMKAEEVDRLGYGDCKALTNYTRSLLSAAGIKSYYTEVNAGPDKKSYLPDFASAFQGNHAILCVPVAQDTIWLECTSREAPMGYLGTFTDNRRVLLYTENGGVIARTKRYAPEQNRQIRKATLHLDEKGALQGNLETRFEGIQYDNRDHLISTTGKERIDLLKEIYPVNNLDITKYFLEAQKSGNPTLTEKMEIKATQYGNLDKNMLVVPIYHLNRNLSVPKEVRIRKQKVTLNRGFYDEDVITFNLPPDYKADYIPAPVTLENEFGSYVTSVQFTGGQLIYTRKLLMKEGEFSSEAYERLHSFLKKVVDADGQKFVLVKQ
jgi:transglutaminase-like putative cysteine protease